MGNKLVYILGFIFTGVGLLLTGTEIYIAATTVHFVATASRATGNVFEIKISSSRDTNGDLNTYYSPEIEFTDDGGSTITFVSDVESSYESYSVGDTVPVIYDPANPHHANIDSFFRIWGTALMSGVMGVAFLFAGVGILIYLGIKSKRRQWLKQNGTIIQAEVISCDMNTSISVMGRHPYSIRAQYLDSDTRIVHVFESDPIWYDPSQFIKNKQVQVFVDPNNLKKYFIDLSDLPKME